MTRSVVVVGGTSGIGKEVARHFVGAGDDVTVTGRDPGRSEEAAKDLGGSTFAVTFDLERPHGIAAALEPLSRVDHLVLTAIERDESTARDYDVDRALRLVTQTLVGYTEVVHVLLSRMGRDASVVMLGGQAMERPCRGSTTVSTVNGGVVGMVHTLALELAPVRVNGLHPGMVRESTYWSGKPEAVLESHAARTPSSRLTTMADIVDATVFLLRNRSVTGVNLNVDAGWMLT